MTSEPEKPAAFGPFTLSVAKAAQPLQGTRPLVVISHGTGGSPLTHRELARHLASLGFVVAMPEHPHDNRGDVSRAGKLQ